MTHDTQRPDPEKLLAQMKNEGRRTRRHGRLKIFFGSSAGVGKTYAMLSAAQELRKQGVDVLIGFIETHGRPQTEALMEGLPVLTPNALTYRGVTLYELDLEKALARKPATILVDELAHTNAPGSRHPKRWRDVIELLDAGINVFTTLNVQHIESLSDVVANATGVWVKETIPDSVFDMAEDVVLVDIDPDDLLIRLREGNVYIAPGVSARAAENFFKIDNLNSLREIALRRMAERVDAEREAAQGQMAPRAALADKILVVIDTDYDSLKLIRAAKRLALALHAPWVALHIESGDPQSPSVKAQRRASEMMERMVDRLDGESATVHSANRVEATLAYAHAHGITKIMLGKPEGFSVRAYLKDRETRAVLQGSGAIDVMLITLSPAQKDKAAQTSALAAFRPLNYLIALILVFAFTLPGIALSHVLTTTDQALLYLTGCVLVAERIGLGPALFYALLAASAFNIFFSRVHLVQHIDSRAALMTFAVMLITGYAIATQAVRLRDQAASAREKEEKTRALYDLTRKLTGSRGRQPVAQVVGDYIAKAYGASVTAWMTNADGHPAVILGDLPQETYYKDFGALQWCFENSRVAGRGTTTMPSAAGFYLPLTTGQETVGAIGLYPAEPERLYTHDEIAALETLAGLLASALLRVRAGEIAAQAIVESENKKLREQLLTHFSHDFGSPIEAIASTAANLMRHDRPVDPADVKEVAGTIQKEATTLSETVGKLLQAGKLEGGAVEPQRNPSSIHERIDKTLARLEPTLTHHTIRKKVEDNLPDVLIDPAMIEQLLGNLLDNAAQFSPQGTTITIEARRQGEMMLITVDDEGAGLPKGFEDKIFDKFCSFVAPEGGRRTGLGLTIAAGIARLHHGLLWAENRAEGGARFALTLPLA